MKRPPANLPPGARALLASATPTAVATGAEETAGVSFDPERVRTQLRRAMSAGGEVLGATQATPSPTPSAAPRGPSAPAPAPGVISETDRAAALGAVDRLTQKTLRGGSGVWGPVPMPPSPNVSEAEARQLVTWILTLR